MRFLLFCILVILSTLLPWPGLLLLAIGYALYVSAAYELIVLGGLIDAYYGVAVVVPYYTLVAVAIVLCIELIKPLLSVYTDEYSLR